MSSHYKRTTPETRLEQLKTIRSFFVKPHEDKLTHCIGNLALDIDHAINAAEKSHKAPLISEGMMIHASMLYNMIAKLYNEQDCYVVNAEESKAHNVKFAKQQKLFPRARKLI